ncbi:MAG: glycosyltransferase family 4 protein [Planctomycetota bacterium]
MRILYHHRIRSDDGQAVHVRELIRALRQEGHQVLECALVPKATDSEPGADQPSPQSKGEAPESGGGGLWSKLSLPRVATECLEIAYGGQGARRILKAAESFQPDLIYERHSLHLDSALRAGRKLSIPVFVEVNSPLVDEMKTLSLLKFEGRARRTEKRVLSSVDRVFAVTEVLRQELISLGSVPERTVVTPNGVDLARYGVALESAAAEFRQAAGVLDGDFVLGFVGYMRDWHRLDLAIRLLTRPGFESARIVLVGDGPALPGLHDLAAEQGVSDRVHAVGTRTAEELPAVVKAFDAALIPAINRYASPLKLFDSLAAGVATLAPDQPNLRETIDDGLDGVLFEPGDRESLEKALLPLVRDRALADRIGAAGRQRLEREDWTWRGNAKRVVTEFERLQSEVNR